MQTELAIIGAGPAGMAAATRAVALGVDVTIIDEQAREGGQILRSPPPGFDVPHWLSDRVYRPLHALRQRFDEDARISKRFRHTAQGIFGRRGDFEIVVEGAGGIDVLHAQRLLIAGGCHDMPVAFPGAQLPGVMSAGGIQAFVKSQQFLPGDRFVFAGSHPLQLLVADQVAKAGGEVAAIVFSQSPAQFLRWLRHPLTLAVQGDNLLLFSRALGRLLRRRIPLRFGRHLLAADGEAQLESVQLGRFDGDSFDAVETLQCDRLGFCYGFLSQSELARQAGVACDWSQAGGGWIARHDESMQASVPGIYVAGETTGVAGAAVARHEGTLAALGVAHDLDRLDATAWRDSAAAVRPALGRAQAFANLLHDFAFPGSAYLRSLMTAETLLCKCEEVTADAVLQVLAQQPAPSDLSGVKLLSRCGMGMCQGRYCHYALRQLVADTLQRAPGEVGGFTARFPCKPMSIASVLVRRPL